MEAGSWDLFPRRRANSILLEGFIRTVAELSRSGNPAPTVDGECWPDGGDGLAWPVRGHPLDEVDGTVPRGDCLVSSCLGCEGVAQVGVGQHVDSPKLLRIPPDE